MKNDKLMPIRPLTALGAVAVVAMLTAVGITRSTESRGARPKISTSGAVEVSPIDTSSPLEAFTEEMSAALEMESDARALEAAAKGEADSEGRPKVAPATAPLTAPPFAQDKRVRQAAERGLAYLAARQHPSGGWVQDVGYKFNYDYKVTTSGRPHVGVTSLALMAFLSGGHLPGRGRYSDVVQRGTDYVLSAVDEDTGYVSANETRMYSHAFATLFLAEIFGMTHRPDLRAKLQAAVDLTVKTQNEQGAWRYHPYAPDSDMSIAVCQLMALRAARNIGIQVPRSTIDRAYRYLQLSQRRVGRREIAFRYQIDRQNDRVSFALSAAGLASLMHSGHYEDQMIKPAVQWLKGRIRSAQRQERYPTYFFWYGHYYAAQVMFMAGDRDPDLWDKFYWPHIRNKLLEYQNDDGSWSNTPGPGPIFGTAVAGIILQIPYQYLPIFQR